MIRVWPWPMAPAVHSTRKRRSASRRLDSWFATDDGSSAVSLLEHFSPVASAPVPTAAVETAATVETATESAAVRPSRESVGTESPIEGAEALLAHLSGLMRLFVFGRRPADASPTSTSRVFLPVALAVPTVYVAVATRIHVGSAEAPSSDVPVIDEMIPCGANVFAPVVVNVHVTDAVMPAPATAAVPPPAVMPSPVGSDGEAEFEPGEDVDPEAQVKRAPAPGHRPRVPECAGPTRIDVSGAVDHDWSGRHHRPEIARRVARVHNVRCGT